jgi:geranylgeranyl diphosphate synthase type II
MTSFDSVRSFLLETREYVDSALEKLCSTPPEKTPERLWEAMRYSLLAGGKRLRPALCFAAGELFGEARERLLPMALAFEMVHTASLIHDDLPCMDNDALRRGRPTNHVVFGEGLALLAGDALLALAFAYPADHLPRCGVPAPRIVRALGVFADAVGPKGICGGQVLDSDPASRKDAVEFVREIAEQKTATLIRASLLTGAILAGAEETALQQLSDYGTNLGLAFQIVDDILDATASVEELGKTPGKDAAQGKTTFVSVFGVDGARKCALEATRKAQAAIEAIEGAALLWDLAAYLEHRSR